MNKIIGVTVGTPTSPKKMEQEINPVKTVNGVAPDANGNVEVKAGTNFLAFESLADVPTDLPEGTIVLIPSGNDDENGEDPKIIAFGNESDYTENILEYYSGFYKVSDRSLTQEELESATLYVEYVWNGWETQAKTYAFVEVSMDELDGGLRATIMEGAAGATVLRTYEGGYQPKGTYIDFRGIRSVLRDTTTGSAMADEFEITGGEIRLA